MSRWLLFLLYLGLGGFSLQAMGQMEFTQEILIQPGVPQDDNAPVRRTYPSISLPRALEVAGPVTLTIKNGPGPLVIQGTPSLLAQTWLEWDKSGNLRILLERGVGGKLEAGRLDVSIGVASLENLIIRTGSVATIDLDQGIPLGLEVRDQGILRGKLKTPEINGLVTWKSEVRITGSGGRGKWRIKGDSRADCSGFSLVSLDLESQEASVFLAPGGTYELKGELRTGSLLEVSPGQNLENLKLREFSSVMERNP